MNPKSRPTAAAATIDGREIKDAGNDPSTAGCLELYRTRNQTCQNPFEQWGDWCYSATHLFERVDPVQCSNQSFVVQLIDCRQHLNDPRARCITVPNHCPLNNPLNDPDSAHCVIPIVNPTIDY